jgi:hypothetical protein
LRGEETRYKVQGSRFKVQGTRYKVQGTRHKVQGTRYKVQGSRHKVQFSGFLKFIGDPKFRACALFSCALVLLGVGGIRIIYYTAL